MRVLVGQERHDTVDLALRYLGLGAPEPVRADEQGRLDARALETALRAGTGPTVVCLQAGNVHSGGYDPFAEAIEVAHRHGAWVHVDGAFGLFAAAAPAYHHLTEGIAGADSWATDAHKTLNVPYDCGIAIVRDPAAVKAAMGMHGDYLIHDAAGDPFEKVPELSRRARSIPVWAVLAALGRRGVADLVERMAGHAAAFARGIADDPGRRGAQRRGLHPGLRQLRRRRPDARGRGTAAGGRRGVDERLAVARPGGAAHLGEQLVDRPRVTFVAACARSREPRAPSRVPNRVDAAPSVD